MSCRIAYRVSAVAVHEPSVSAAPAGERQIVRRDGDEPAAVEEQADFLVPGLDRQAAGVSAPREDLDEIRHADIGELANGRHRLLLAIIRSSRDPVSGRTSDGRELIFPSSASNVQGAVPAGRS